MTSNDYHNKADSLTASANGLRSSGNTWHETQYNYRQAQQYEQLAAHYRNMALLLEKQGKKCGAFVVTGF